ncbi:hypothetical protein LCGC14_2130480 [marine sediment metagenome]|uniref:Uncharacterized protein n=1 Tax=marine sediment metagenome TaxID=412755 RepID=A0A0F9E1J8_9ZZZZ
MRKNKLISMLIFSALIFGTIGGAIGYQEYIYRWVNNGAGGTHGACHGSSNTKESVLGTMVLTINETGNLLTGQAFELSVAVLNFTEANLAPYNGRFTLGVPGYQGDNALFTSGLSHQTLNRGEAVDTWGSYNDSNADNEFMLFAPMIPGTYNLTAVAIAGMNQSDESSYNLTYVQEYISINVVEIIDTTHPIITVAPTVKTVAHDYTGQSFSWTATDINPDTYRIYLNGTVNVTSTTWTSAAPVSYNIPDGLAPGPHIFKIVFADLLGNTVVHTAVLIVNPESEAAPGPTISGGLLTVIVGSIFGVTTILILGIRKKVRKREL